MKSVAYSVHEKVDLKAEHLVVLKVVRWVVNSAETTVA